MTLLRCRAHAHRIALASLAIALGACSSSSSDGPAALDLNGFGAKYKIADNEIAGWTVSTEPAAFDLYSAENLTEKIDGPAANYVSHGCKYAMFEEMVGPTDPNQQFCRVVAMDFGTEAQAASMVTYQRESSAGITEIPGYDASLVFGYPVLTGLTVYGNFGALYFEVILDGFPGDPDTAGQVGAKFLQALQAKNQ
jgi:hypothetical protein